MWELIREHKASFTQLWHCVPCHPAYREPQSYADALIPHWSTMTNTVTAQIFMIGRIPPGADVFMSLDQKAGALEVL